MPNMALIRLDGPAPRVAKAALKPPDSAPNPRPTRNAAASISGQMGAKIRPSSPKANAALPTITEARSGQRSSKAPSTTGPRALPRKWALLMPATAARLTPNCCSKRTKAGP